MAGRWRVGCPSKKYRLSSQCDLCLSMGQLGKANPLPVSPLRRYGEYSPRISGNVLVLEPSQIVQVRLAHVIKSQIPDREIMPGHAQKYGIVSNIPCLIAGLAIDLRSPL